MGTEAQKVENLVKSQFFFAPYLPVKLEFGMEAYNIYGYVGWSWL